jgi:hypothetical protein
MRSARWIGINALVGDAREIQTSSMVWERTERLGNEAGAVP